MDESAPRASVWRRALGRLRRAWTRPVSNRPLRMRMLTAAVLVVAGFMMTTSSLAARGTDLRPSRNSDLVGLVTDRARTNRELAEQVAALRAEVDALSRANTGSDDLAERVATVSDQAGLSALHGPAVRVTLTDAPISVNPEGVDGDLLVVHQQDIQAVANALWAAGAEAMTIQGQRVTSRTGIKCVGNTVVLHGIPYAPPYVITAIGDQGALEAGLNASAYLVSYREYSRAYGLGYRQERVADAQMPAYTGAYELRYAGKR